MVLIYATDNPGRLVGRDQMRTARNASTAIVTTSTTNTNLASRCRIASNHRKRRVMAKLRGLPAWLTLNVKTQRVTPHCASQRVRPATHQLLRHSVRRQRYTLSRRSACPGPWLRSQAVLAAVAERAVLGRKQQDLRTNETRWPRDSRGESED